MYRWKVSSKDCSKRLISFIKEKVKKDVSNRFIKKAIERGVCSINGKTECFASFLVTKDDVVTLDNNWDKAALDIKIEKIPILYEDDQFVIIDKPTSIFYLYQESHWLLPEYLQQ